MSTRLVCLSLSLIYISYYEHRNSGITSLSQKITPFSLFLTHHFSGCSKAFRLSLEGSGIHLRILTVVHVVEGVCYHVQGLRFKPQGPTCNGESFRIDEASAGVSLFLSPHSPRFSQILCLMKRKKSAGSGSSL